MMLKLLLNSYIQDCHFLVTIEIEFSKGAIIRMEEMLLIGALKKSLL